MDISKLLTFSAKEGASDCHISAGEPPMIRIHGDLKKLDHPPLTAEETHALVYDMMSDAQRKNFEEKRECDFSFELGDIARFRVNVFVQQGRVGKTSDVVFIADGGEADGLHLFKVFEEEERTPEGRQLDDLKANAFGDWYAEKKDALASSIDRGEGG